MLRIDNLKLPVGVKEDKLRAACAHALRVSEEALVSVHLLRRSIDAREGVKLLLDLYCGAGTIGLSMAGKARRLIGAEIVPQAVENARRNAERNSIGNAEFICADAGQAAKQLESAGERPDVIILDPPRKGCDDATLTACAGMQPERIVMISCNAATAARDCKRLEELGYALKKVRPFDLFPRTSHVECAAVLIKK